MVDGGDAWRGGGELKGFNKHGPDKFIIFLFP